MKKIFILIFLSIYIYASTCNNGFEIKKALIYYQPDHKTIKNVLCPTLISSNDSCIKLDFQFTQDNDIKCVYYELNKNEVNDFKKIEMKNEFLKEKGYNADLISNNTKFIGKNRLEKIRIINQEILDKNNQTGNGSLGVYFPEYKMTFLKNGIKKLSDVADFSWKFGNSVTKENGMCKRCYNELNQPSVSLNNVLEDILNQITDLQNQIKKQVTDVTDELGSTLYDLTSDESVMTYYITGLSYGIASAKCIMKQKLDLSGDALDLGWLTAKTIATSSTAVKTNVNDTTVQKETSTNNGCFFSFNGKCLLKNPLSGIELGGSKKTRETDKSSAALETLGTAGQIDNDKYNACMKTEPNKVMNKIVGYLKKVVNGVDVDLFATKRCTDESLRKDFGLGITNYGQEEEKINQLLLEKYINKKISEIDFFTQQSVGYLDKKNNEVYNMINGIQGKNNTGIDFQKQLELNFKGRINKDNIYNFLIKKYVTDTNYNPDIKSVLSTQAKYIANVFNELNNIKNKLVSLSNEMGKNNISRNLSNFIVNSNLKVLKELNNEVFKLFNKIHNNQQTSYSRKIGCISYNSNNICNKIGLKYDIYGKLDEIFRNYKIKNLDDVYLMFKDKTLQSIQNYIDTELLKNGDLSNIQSSDTYELLIEYYKVLSFKNIINILQQSELEVGDKTIPMGIKETQDLNKVIYQMFNTDNFNFTNQNTSN